MKDFTQIDLVIRSHIAERERETQTLLRTRSLRAAAKPHRLRAALAAKLARLALHIDREAARTLAAREVRTAGRRG